MSCLDAEEPCGLNKGKQTICIGVCGCCSLIGFITFCVIISAYHHLGPDDQLLVRKGGVYYAYNGPWSGQLNPGHKKIWRKALKLEANEYAKILNKKTNERWVAVGPYFDFMEAEESTYMKGEKIVLARDEYVRLVNIWNGQERIVAGPMMLYENVSDNFARMRLVKKKASFLDQDTAAVIANKNTGTLSLMTYCDPSVTSALYVPPPLTRVVEERKLTYIKPHEVFVIRDELGATHFYDGGDPASVGDFRCSAGASEPGGGNAFWLPPYSRIVRMQWSDYGQPPTAATSLTQTTVVSGTRRRRTSRNSVVVGKTWPTQPKWWFVAGDFNKDENQGFWQNRGSGPNLTKVVRAGAVTVTDAVGGGPSANLMSIRGTASTQLVLGNLLEWSFTLCTLTRYAGSTRRSVLTDYGGFAHGHFAGKTGVAQYKTNITQMLVDLVEPVLDWVPMCVKTGNAPKNVLVGDDFVGVAPTPPMYPDIGVNTISYHSSDFALAEIIAWPTALSDEEMLDAMAYLKARMDDAKTFWDQPSTLGEKKNTRLVTVLDKRMQRSFYKFEVRSQDNVRMLIEGTVYWQIVEPRRAVNGTADPEGDVWLRARSTLIGLVSSVTFNTFLLSFNTLVQNSFLVERTDPFYSDRGIELIGIDVLNFSPTDARTITSLNTLIKAKTERMVALAKQRTSNELRGIQIESNLRMEGNRTSLIQAKALNDRVEAETRGATEGGRKATTVNAFLNGIAAQFPDVAERVKLYREHIVRQALGVQTKNLFSGSGRVFLKPKGQNLTLLLPTDARYALPDERRLQAAKPAAEAAATEEVSRVRHLSEL